MCTTSPAPQASSHHHIEEVAAMINLRPQRIAISSAILIMLAGTLAIPAAARPLEPDRPGPTRTIAVSDSSLTCPLRRIDEQLVRCDNLTGAGVAAPLFISEL